MSRFSPILSDSPQESESSPLSNRPRRRPTRRRLLHRRRRPLPPSTTTSSSISPQSKTPDDLTSSDKDTQLNSYSQNTSISFISSSSATSAPPLAYINVAPLPIFRGLPGECPVAHLTRFERVCNANNASSLSMMARIFPVTLLDDAALWYELSVEPHPDMSWVATKSAFLLAFRRPEFADKARAEILSLRQREGESVTSYHLRMQRILKGWPEHGLPDSLVRGLFMDGLREEFHDWVVPRKPETVGEAVRLAMDWEGAQAARVARRTAGEGERCGFCEGSHGEVDCEVKRRMKEWMTRTRGEELKSTGGEGKVKDEQRGVERFGRVGSIGRRSLCQCWKHQCWKKYEGNGSAFTIKNAAPNVEVALDAAAAASLADS